MFKWIFVEMPKFGVAMLTVDKKLVFPRANYPMWCHNNVLSTLKKCYISSI